MRPLPPLRLPARTEHPPSGPQPSHPGLRHRGAGTLSQLKVGLNQYVAVTALGRPTVAACIIEGGLLTQVQTHATENLGPINLAVL